MDVGHVAEVLATACLAGGGFAGAYYPIHAHYRRQRKHRSLQETREIVRDELHAQDEKLAEHFAEVQATTTVLRADLTGMTVRLASELGGNSGGIRQAVNHVSDELARTREDVANLRGSFDQHVQQTERGNAHAQRH